jgi:hypothetical protein
MGEIARMIPRGMRGAGQGELPAEVIFVEAGGGFA